MIHRAFTVYYDDENGEARVDVSSRFADADAVMVADVLRDVREDCDARYSAAVLRVFPQLLSPPMPKGVM